MMHPVVMVSIIGICFVDTTSPSHVNLALGRATLSSSNVDKSDRAVDGDKDPDVGAGSCTKTQPESNPWWSVDLQHSYLLGKVLITNRKASEDLENVRIGTTDTNPAVTAPSPENIRICASRDPPVDEGVTEPFSCLATGRYLVVLLEGPAHTLAMCEVEVFEMRVRMHFLKTASSRLVGHAIESAGVRSKLQCAEVCIHNPLCGSFNLNVSGSVVQCELNAETSPQQTADDMTADTQWTFHQGTEIH